MENRGKNTAILSDLEGNVFPDVVSIRRIRPLSGYKENFQADLIGKGREGPLDVAQKKETVASIHVSNKTMVRNDVPMTLVYVHGIRKCGVWVPSSCVL